ncbi:MAG: hypothetical protein SPK90_03555 [Bacteroidales bacterium]|nr:hypothetical protein [Bacteroidales bacterium]MDY6406813.1 hypothetical protein [Bacteroidales bacterium]
MKKFFTFVAAAFAALTMNAQAISVADAITACMALDSAAISESEYTIEGFVVDAQDFNPTYGNQIFFLADDATNSQKQQFEVYGGIAKDNDVVVKVLNGDKVNVTAKLKKYYDKNASAFIAETVSGAAVTFISKVDGDRAVAGSTEINVAKALEIAKDYTDKQKSPDTYDIVGYVTNIIEDAMESHGNMTFWMADANNGADSNEKGAIEVYRGKPAEVLAVGDKISIKTQIQNYGGVIETVSGAAITILQKGGGEPVEEADVVFLPADFEGQGQAATQETPGGAVSTTKGDVTVSTDNGYGHSLALRVYKGGRFAITSSEQQIGKVVFKFYSTYNGGLDNEVVVNDNEFVVESMASQARIEKISIFFGEYEKPEVDTLTAAEALAAAQALEVGATQKVVCMAYIANIKTPYSEEFGNITVFLTDDPTSTYGDIQAYRAKCSAEDGAAIAEHDLVLVEGNVTHTQNQEGTKDYYEFAAGAQLKLLEKAQGIENIELTEKVQKVVVDGVIYIIRDNKMFNVQGTQVR